MDNSKNIKIDKKWWESEMEPHCPHGAMVDEGSTEFDRENPSMKPIDRQKTLKKGGSLVLTGEVVEGFEHYRFTFFRYEMSGSDRSFAATLLTEVVLHELGCGDNENHGLGDLKNCQGDIWNHLFHDGSYRYADLLFTIKEK
jgi:hypothetical protein